MIPDLQYYLSRPYRIHIVPDCGTEGEQLYFATVAELPGCESHGATLEEAARNVRDAMALYLESMIEDGLIPPEPQENGVNAVWSLLPRQRTISSSHGLPDHANLAHA